MNFKRNQQLNPQNKQ